MAYLNDRDHQHRYQAFNNKSMFEMTGNTDELGNDLYIMVEYVFSNCSCGAALKTPVSMYKEDK